jgi:type II secretory pathway component GspD/PulD (secretin)
MPAVPESAAQENPMQSRFAQKFGPSHKPLRRLVPVLAVGALTAAASILPGWAAPAAPHHSVPRSACADASDVSLDFVAADINDVLKALALQTHSNIVSATDVKGTITVSLSHVTLEEALNVISKLSGYQYAKVGSTYVVGSAASIATLKDGGDDATQTAVIPFTYSSADDIANIVKQLVPNAKITPGKAAGGTGGVFVVTGTQADIDKVRDVVSQAETALSKNIADSQTVLYNIKYVSSADLETVLTRLAPNVIVTPGPTQGFALSAPATADAGGVTSSTTSYGAPTTGTGGTTTSVTSSLPTKPTTTSLLLSGSVTDIAKAQAILAQVDIRPVQINYDAKVTEISLNDAKQFGLNYSFAGATTRIGEQTSGNGDNAVAGGTPTLGDNGFGGLKNLFSFNKISRTAIGNLVTISLDAAIQNGDAKLLSDPNISALDGQPAATFIGDNITYVSSITTSSTGQNITTATASAGIKLFVTGKVNNDGYITLNIHPEVSTLTFKTGIGGAQLPDISTREVTTTVRVHDGDTVAIGGLISQQDVKNIQKVPILGDLPFFGNLFRDVNTTHSRDEIVIFLKVSIQKDKPGA